MSEIDDAILDIDKKICDNIDNIDDIKLLSSNILDSLRDLVEHTIVKLVNKGNDNIDVYTVKGYWEIIKPSIDKFRGAEAKYKFLIEFHTQLQISTSHYTLSQDGSERLLYSYFGYLVKIKKLYYDEFNIRILHNINKIQFENDQYSIIFYRKIAQLLRRHKNDTSTITSDRFYIVKKKAIFVDNEIFYEITLSPVNSIISKFDRIVAYSYIDIGENYSVRINLVNGMVLLPFTSIRVSIICNWIVSIRPCEIEHLSEIIGCHIRVDSGSNEYKLLMNYLTDSKNTLLDLCYIDSKKTREIFYSTKSQNLMTVISVCGEIIQNNHPGSNVLRYLLYKMENTILKRQIDCSQNPNLSNLYLKNGCIPFDTMPFCTSLINHNPSLTDLFNCINMAGREHELLVRAVHSCCDSRGELFVRISSNYDIDVMTKQIKKYNSNLHQSHDGRRLEIYKNHLFVKEYVDSFISICNIINGYTGNGIFHYTNYVQKLIDDETIVVDCQSKKSILLDMFDNDRVAIINGSAGTGKTKLLDYISIIFSNINKIFLANTNAAVENLRRKITGQKSFFETVDSFNYRSDCNKYNMLIVDECGTVCNSDLLKILKSNNYGILIFVGDVFQLKSIKFGNWFSLICSFVPKKIIYHLSTTYRTDKQRLLPKLCYGL